MTIQTSAVREMIERVIELSRTYAIWWALVNQQNFEKYRAVINGHSDFFEATTHSLFQGFSVITYQLFETRRRKRDTNSIPRLIDDLKSSDAALARQLELAVDENRPLLGNFFDIRGSVYAHRNKAKTPERVFAAAGVSAKKMQAVVALAQDLVATLGEAAGVDAKRELAADIKLREEFSAEDTRRIMEALRNHEFSRPDVTKT
ncbi:MAG: hypothetical protein WCC36_03450 [Gammaproteobacteria bacterium]